MTPWELVLWGFAAGWVVFFVALPIAALTAWVSAMRRSSEVRKILAVNARPTSSRSSR